MSSALDGWMAAFAADGWVGASLHGAAQAAGLSLGEVAEVAPDAWTAIERAADRGDLAAIGGSAGDGSGPRDRLFDVIMARFDALSGSREAHQRLLHDARTRPALAIALTALVGRTAARTLGAAGLGSTGLAGIVRVNALAAIIVDVGRVWLEDADADLGDTMRRLDERLGLAERWAGKLNGFRATVPPELIALERDRFDTAGAAA